MNKENILIKKHDEGYKSFFKDKKTFFEFLEDFIKKDWTKGLNENDWELIDKEFIDENLRRRESDIVYKGKIHDQEVIVYILIELQSSVDYTMPIRLLFYMSEIWKNEFFNINKNERERADYKLPPIIPIVLFNGKNKWTVSTEFKNKVMANDITDYKHLDFEYVLFNINKFDDIMLLNNESIISKIFYLDKEKDISEMGHRLMNLGNEWTQKMTEEQQELFKTWLRIMLENNKQKIVDNTIKNVLEEINFKDGDEMVSNFGRNLVKYFEEAKKEGLQQGIEEGRQEGRQEGMRASLSEVVRKSLAMGMDIETIKAITGLSSKDIEEIEDSK